MFITLSSLLINLHINEEPNSHGKLVNRLVRCVSQLMTIDIEFYY